MASLSISQSQNFDNCCRTCLNDVALQVHDIFEEALQGSATVAEMLNRCTLLKVAKDDDLPKKLCERCYDCLQTFYDFRELAEKVDIQLKLHNEKRRLSLQRQDKDDIKLMENIFEVKIERETKQEPEYNSGDDSNKHIKEEFSLFNEKSESEDYEFDNYDNCEPVKDNLKCKQCYKKFTSLTKLQEHQQRGSCLTIYSCDFCCQTFKKHYKYVKHLIIHGQDDFQSEINQNNVNSSIPCTVCSLKFKSVNSLAAHMRKHTKKGRVLSCSICGKVFTKLSHVKRHELIHEENRPFKCSTCPKRFNTESNLNYHINNKHNNSHVCPMCNKTFPHQSTLSAHIRIHRRDKPFLCPTCGKRFDFSTNLNQHMKRHIGLKKFACNICPKSFITKGELQSHSASHGSERPWRCPRGDCGASFVRRKSLDQHTKRHAGLKPHQCDTCPMRFITKDHLKRHYRIHTGEKPYKCQYCERAFTQSNDLVKHTRSHVGQNVYQCNLCETRFRLHSELQRHQSEHYAAGRAGGEGGDTTAARPPRATTTHTHNDKSDIDVESVHEDK